MVPEIVRLERAGVCGCGELVASGDRAGYVAKQARVVCLSCLAGMSTTPRADAAPQAANALVPASWTADERAIAATLDALRKHPVPRWYPAEPAVLHVPTEWSSRPGPAPLAGSGSGSPEQPISLPRRKPGTEGPLDVDVCAPSDLTDDLRNSLAAASPALSTTSPQPTAAASEVPAPAFPTPALPAPTAAPEPSEGDLRPARHEAAVVDDVHAPPPAPRRRAGLFSRLRPQQPRVSKPQAAVRAMLDAAGATGVLSLHDRRVPGRRGRIEHIAISAAGLCVIDVLHFKNASIEVRPADDPEAGTDDLLVGGRVMTASVRAVARRVEVLRLILLAVGLDDVPVTGALCFVDGLLPLAVADLQVGGMHVLRPSGLTALVAGSGPFDQRDRETLREFLAERLPASA